MTRQEIFDKVANHLLTQNATCANSDYNAMCMYRLENMSCAIGCLIPDELYSAQLEGKEVGSELISEVLRKVNIVDEDVFLSNFRHMHDYILPVDWADELLTIAYHYELDSGVLSKYKV